MRGEFHVKRFTILIRSNPNVLEGFNYDEIDVIIDDICKN